MPGAKIHDITPPHEPISVARNMIERAPAATAGIAVLIDPDGLIWWEMAGHAKKDILWALVKMQQELMESEP